MAGIGAWLRTAAWLAGWGSACAAAAGLQRDAAADLALIALDTPTPRVMPHATARLELVRTDTMGHGWQQRLVAGVRLRAVSDRCPEAACWHGPDADAALLATYAHYLHGDFTVGRGPGLAADIALRTSPFGFDTIGSDRCAALLSRGCPGSRPLNATYLSPRFGAWSFAAQLAGGAGPPTATLRSEWAVGSGQLMAAAVRSGEGRWLAPIGLSLPHGRWRVFGLLSRGREDDGLGRHASLGLTTPWQGGEVRALVSRRRLGGDAAAGQRKFAIGFHRPVSIDWVPFVDLAAVRRDDGTRWTGVDLGARWFWR